MLARFQPAAFNKAHFFIKNAGIQLDIIGIGGTPEEVNESELRDLASVVNGSVRYWFIRSADELLMRFESLTVREASWITGLRRT